MSSPIKINYLKGIVICHGKSEVNMVRYITTNLHLSVKQFSKDNGKYSIQITSLMSVMDSSPFNTLSSFTKEYPIEVIRRSSQKVLKNFKLFIIMDTDDCTPEQKEAFISKTMFQKHWLYDYIVPIYSINSLEDVLVDAQIMTKRIGDKEKVTYYAKIFPINTHPLSPDTISEVKTFRDKLTRTNRTNMLEFIDYCLTLINQ